MSWKNTLCTDSRCDLGCWHLGPQGQQCWFTAEKKLCNALGLIWHQGFELDHLITLVQDKLAQLPGPEDYAGQIKLATQRTHPAILTAEPEDK